MTKRTGRSFHASLKAAENFCQSSVIKNLSNSLHQRSEQAQGLSHKTLEEWEIPAVCYGDLLALFQGFLVVILHLGHHRVLIKVSGALKMKVKASEIQVDGSYYCLLVVAGEDLPMDKARRILKDSYPGCQKLLIVGAGQQIG